MNSNPVAHRTLIIRSQAEYSAVTQSVSFRCILETPSTGQRQGFTDLEALLTALCTELMGFQKGIIPPNQQNLKSPAVTGSTSATPDPGS